MKSNFFLRLIIFCCVFCVFRAACAAPITETEAASWARDKGRQLLQTFSEPDLQVRYAKLDEMFLNYVDLDYIAKFVIGKYWRQMTAEQKRRYVPLFKRYALAIYKSFPLDFARNVDFVVSGVKPDRKYADVITEISLAGNTPEEQNGAQAQKFIVTFRLTRNNGKLQIIDLKLTESSLILSYRSRFYEMIMQDDGELEWFLEDLELITSSTEETNRQRLSDRQAD